MGNVITTDVTEAEHKTPQPNKYEVYDIRIALSEQIIIILTMGTLHFKEGGWVFCLTIWCFVFVMTLIRTYKIRKGLGGGKNNDSI